MQSFVFRVVLNDSNDNIGEAKGFEHHKKASLFMAYSI